MIAALFAGLQSEALHGATESITRNRDEAEIRAVLSAQVAAWNRGDIDGFMNGYARSPATEFHFRRQAHPRLANGARSL